MVSTAIILSVPAPPSWRASSIPSRAAAASSPSRPAAFRPAAQLALAPRGGLLPGHRRGHAQLRPQQPHPLAAGPAGRGLFAGRGRYRHRAGLYISPDLLGKVLVLLLPFAMLATLMPKKEQKNPPLTSGRRYWILAPLCFLIVGIYDGFFGPGTGSFLILALHWVLRISSSKPRPRPRS